MKKNSKRTILLASNSPRRQELLRQAGIEFQVIQNEFDEEFPPDMAPESVPVFLAREKALQHRETLLNDQVLITADTIVKVGNRILGKPLNKDEAFAMIRELSGKVHEVITGVCLLTQSQLVLFDETTLVEFRELTDQEIIFYISEYKPYDKAGAYGIQEWIGLVGIKRIEGSYFNVVGLPVERLWTELQKLNNESPK